MLKEIIEEVWIKFQETVYPSESIKLSYNYQDQLACSQNFALIRMSDVFQWFVNYKKTP